MKQVVLNITREQAADFIDWLANEGQTVTDFDLIHGQERMEFVINGHTLSNYSNQQCELIIDGCYYLAGRIGAYSINGVRYSPIEYCLRRLGF